MSKEVAENFHVDQKGRRTSKRRSSILKPSRLRPFDEIQNTSHDRNRRVSFCSSVQIKEFINDRNKTTNQSGGSIKVPRDPPRAPSDPSKAPGSVQISTPKAEYSGRQRLSIDRLSIIPKFERSFVGEDSGDTEDFEPYRDELSPLASEPVVEGQAGSGVTAHDNEHQVEPLPGVVVVTGEGELCMAYKEGAGILKGDVTSTKALIADGDQNVSTLNRVEASDDPTLNKTGIANVGGVNGSVAMDVDGISNSDSMTLNNTGAEGLTRVDCDAMIMTLNKSGAEGLTGVSNSEEVLTTINKSGVENLTRVNNSDAMIMTLIKSGGEDLTGVSNSKEMLTTMNKSGAEGLTGVNNNDVTLIGGLTDGSDAMIMTPGADGVAVSNNSDAMVITLSKTAGNVTLGLCEGEDRMDGDAMILTQGNMSFTVHEEDGMNGDVMKTAATDSTSYDDGDGMILTPNKTAVNKSGEDRMALTCNKTSLGNSCGAEDMDITLLKNDETSVVETILESSLKCVEMSASAPAYCSEQQTTTVLGTGTLDNTYTVPKETDVVAIDRPAVVSKSASPLATTASSPPLASAPIIPMTASSLKLSSASITTSVTTAITSPTESKSPTSARKPGRPRSTATAPSPKRAKSPASAKKRGRPPLNNSTAPSPVGAKKAGRPPLKNPKQAGSSHPGVQAAKPPPGVPAEEAAKPLSRVPAKEAAKQVPGSKNEEVSPLQNTSRKRGRPPKSVHIPQNILPKRVAISTPLSKPTGSAARCTPVMSAGLNSSRRTRSRVQSTSKEKEATNSSKILSHTSEPCDMELTTVAPSGIIQSCDMELTTMDAACKVHTPLYINQPCDKVLRTTSSVPKSHSLACGASKGATVVIAKPSTGPSEVGQNRQEVTTSTFNSNSTSDQLTSVTTITSGAMTSVTPSSLTPSPVDDAAGESNQALNGTMVIGDEGNWLQNHDKDFLLLEPTSDSSSGLTSSSSLTAETTPSSVSQKKCKFPSKQKKQTPLTASLLQKLKEKTHAPVQVMEIETPETVAIDHRTAAMPNLDSVVPSPELTIVEERLKNRQSLMMSPSVFKKFEDKLDEEKSLVADISTCVEVSANGEELLSALEKASISQSAAIMEDGGSDVEIAQSDVTPHSHNSLSSTHPSNSQPHPSPFQLAHDTLSHPQELSPGNSTSQSLSLPACRFQLAKVLKSQLHSSSSGSELQPHPSPNRSQPTDVVQSSSPHRSHPVVQSQSYPSHGESQQQPHSSPSKSQLQHSSPSKSQLQPHLSPDKSQQQPILKLHPSPLKSQPVSAGVTSNPHPSPEKALPPLSILSQSPSQSERVSSSPSESVLSPASPEVPTSPISSSIQTHVSSSSEFIMHVHTLRTRYLAIARGCQLRLNSFDYLQTGHSQIDLKPLLESLYTRANLGISVLTLFVSYGGISGLARAKGPLPTAPELPINENSTKEKLLWLQKTHYEIEQNYSNIEATMVQAAEMYHWQLDLWNRSKVNITIHNSAKVAIVLEESLLSTYPQIIKRTNVKHMRGGLLSSKPHTATCKCTADIAQLLWTMIGRKS